jgi:SH3-like domain-containing protein
MLRKLLAVVATALTLAALLPEARAAEALRTGPSGLPLPRFVSLASSEVNVRMGPSRGHKVKWVFKKRGLPVEIIAEFGNWRRVRDSDGEEGWIHGSLLSGERTALVTPWGEDVVPLRSEPRATADPVAFLEPLVLAAVDECDGSWCRISVARWRGLVPQRLLWGVYPRERF